MKKILLIVATVLASFMVYAQPGGPGMGGPGGPGGPMGGSSFSMADPAEMAQKFVDRIKDSLQIDEKQEKSLVKLYTNHFNKLQILQAQLSDLEKETEQRVTSEILTTEQAEKYKTMKKSMRPGRNRNSSGSGDNQNREGGMPPEGPGGGPGGPMM